MLLTLTLCLSLAYSTFSCHSFLLLQQKLQDAKINVKKNAKNSAKTSAKRSLELRETKEAENDALVA